MHSAVWQAPARRRRSRRCRQFSHIALADPAASPIDAHAVSPQIHGFPYIAAGFHRSQTPPWGYCRHPRHYGVRFHVPGYSPKVHGQDPRWSAVFSSAKKRIRSDYTGKEHCRRQLRSLPDARFFHAHPSEKRLRGQGLPALYVPLR